MKPFNLEEYLKNPNQKLITRDGRKVTRVLCTDARGPYPVIVLVERSDSDSDVAMSYTEGGSFSPGGIHSSDLCFASVKHEGWANVFVSTDGIRYVEGRIFESKEDAERYGKKRGGYKATIKAEWEE